MSHVIDGMEMVTVGELAELVGRAKMSVQSAAKRARLEVKAGEPITGPVPLYVEIDGRMQTAFTPKAVEDYKAYLAAFGGKGGKSSPDGKRNRMIRLSADQELAFSAGQLTAAQQTELASTLRKPTTNNPAKDKERRVKKAQAKAKAEAEVAGAG